jgi:hypothetical protein
MTPSLSASGPEREILLRALRDYSEACTPPALTPGCPFAVEIAPGRRGCAEECVALLAEHGAPPPVEEFLVGEFSLIRQRRPRPRHGPQGISRPFDARAIAFEDEAKPPQLRRTAALLFELRRHLCDPPDDSMQTRRERIAECCSELSRRGFDADFMIRHGLGAEVAMAILLGVVMPTLVASIAKEHGDRLPKLAPAPPEWRDLLLPDLDVDRPEAHLAAVAAQMGAMIGGEHPLIAWVSTAAMDDLVDWTAPSELPAMGRVDYVAEAATHRWLVDRFLATYYEDWATPSLHLEWRYLHGEVLPPCPHEALGVRRTTANEIAPLIADRATKDERQKVPTPLSRYVYAAVETLRSGSRMTAASLFEIVIKFEPTNAEAHNNFGFCVLPDRPADALYHFERSAALGWAQHPFVLVNRIYALAKIGRVTSALELADEFFNLFGMSMPIRGWMWTLDEEPKLLDIEDLACYAKDLVIAITERAGDATLAAKWSARLSGV